MKKLILLPRLVGITIFIQIFLLIGVADTSAYTITTDEAEFFKRYESPSEIITFETLVDGTNFYEASGPPLSSYLTGVSSGGMLEARENAFSPNWYFRSKQTASGGIWHTAVVQRSTPYRHSTIKFVTPGERHRGEDIAILEERRRLYEAAKAKQPERWSGKTRDWTSVEIVYLNPGKPVKKEVELKQKAA